jgi:SAM-dependent methyltransferase
MKVSSKHVYEFLLATESPPASSPEASRERDRYMNSVFGRVAALLRLIEPRPGMRVLEVGAAPFFATRALAHFLALAPGQLALVDGALPCESGATREDWTFAGGDYERWRLNAETRPLPFADGSFDLAVCVDVIEHLIFDPLFLVQQIHRVLKPGGTMILSTSPAVFSWSITLRHLFNRPVESGYDVIGHDPYARHHRLFSLREVRAMAAANGFAVSRAFVTSHPFRNDPLVSLRVRAFKRCLYVLDKASAGLARVLPFLREKAGTQIWVVAARSGRCDAIVYPPTLDLRGEFAEER